MDVREKLVELLKANFYDEYEFEEIADILIAHGVTVQDNTEISDELLKQLRNASLTVLHEEPTVEFVQEWISVKDRLPEPKELVLCIWKDINGIHYGFARYQHDNVWYVSNEGMPEVTHWMALPKKPQPPKGE